MTSKDKLKNLSDILLKSLESANHQTTKYDAEELKDQNEEVLMISTEMKIKLKVDKVSEYLDIIK